MLGIDVGSTTVKIVVMNDRLEVIYREYQRHFSDVKLSTYNLLQSLLMQFEYSKYHITFTGSGAMAVSKSLNLPFIQEVISCKKAVEHFIPDTDVAIELRW